jgi:PPOX class probable F420-dependent enzyme
VAEPTPSRVVRGTAVFDEPLVRELLALRLIAVLATFDRSGGIHAVPMWFARGQDAILFATGSRSRKLRNLERDQSATVVLHDSRPGFEVCGASIQGRVEVVRGAAAARFIESVHRRYVDPAGEALPAAAEFLSSDDVALRFRPDAAVTWDERSSDAARVLCEAGAARALESTAPRRGMDGAAVHPSS